MGHLALRGQSEGLLGNGHGRAYLGVLGEVEHLHGQRPDVPATGSRMSAHKSRVPEAASSSPAIQAREP